MLRRVMKPISVTVLLVVLANVVGIRSAYAVFGVADTGDGILAGILSNTAEALKTSKQMYEQNKDIIDFGKKAFQVGTDTYNLAKKAAQLTEAAVDVGANMRNFSAQRFGTEFREDMMGAFPELAWIQQESNHPFGLGAGNPYNYEIVNAMKYCLADAVNENFKDACTKLKGKTEREQLEASLQIIFKVPTAAQAAAAGPGMTRAEQIELMCKQRFADAYAAADQSRKLNLQVTNNLGQLREKCIEKDLVTTTTSRLKQTYGVGQDLVKSAKTVQGDLTYFNTAQTVDELKMAAAPTDGTLQTETKTQTQKKDDAACAELQRQQQAVEGQMATLNAAATASKNQYDMCMSQLEEARREEAAQRATTQTVALAGAPGKSQAKIGARRPKITPAATAGGSGPWDILADPNGQTPHFQNEGN
jgi:hypothetical protein